LVAQLSAERESELRRREEALSGKEKEMEERRKRIAERRLEMEARRRKIEAESDLMSAQIREEQTEYERLRADAKRAIELEETEQYTASIRQSRSAQIEAEVETKRLKVDRERQIQATLQDERDYHAKLEELHRSKLQVVQAREELHKEIQLQEEQLRARWD